MPVCIIVDTQSDTNRGLSSIMVKAMMSQHIEALRNLYLRFKHECFIACGIAVFGVVYFYPLNRNLLYLSFLGVTYVMFSISFTRFRTMLAALAVFAVLAAIPVNIPKEKFVKLEPDQSQLINGNYYVQLKPGEVWQYNFQVTDIEKHQRECGGNLQGMLVIDGINLSGLEVNIGGYSSLGTDTHLERTYDMDQVLIFLDDNVSGEFAVHLRLKAGASPMIRLGPEAHGFDIYRDAVWLEFKNEQCSVLYHAQRRVIPAQ